MTSLCLPTDPPNLEPKLVFGSYVLCLNGKRPNKFPVDRPLAQPIVVFSENGDFIGRGIGANCNKTGGCIKVDGKKYDSNHILFWLYE